MATSPLPSGQDPGSSGDDLRVPEESPVVSALAQVLRKVARAALGFLWLIPAASLLLVANGRWMLPAAAWLAPIFLLRFVRSQSPWVAALVGPAVVIPICAVAWRGQVPIHGMPGYTFAVGIGLATFFPYLIDRLLSRRLRGYGSTLVFPSAAVVSEYLASSLSPYGTWGASAYTQTYDLPLMQLVSVTGIWGITFLICWFASVVNTLGERGLRDANARAAFLAFIMILISVHLLGGARLRRESPRDTVRIASFTMTMHPPLPLAGVLRHDPSSSGPDAVQSRLEGLRASLLARASREAKAGAQILFWSEANGMVLKQNEEALIGDGATLAHDEGVYLGMAFAQISPGDGTYENRFVLFDPQGEVVADYHKARPVPGAPERGADRHPPVVQTSYGRLGCAIGFDADFPSLIRDAGDSRADILLLPSSDWRGIDPLHTRMALVRGIENGCAVVRQASGGLSSAADARGRVLASVDYLDTEPRVMVAQVPQQGEPTVYARLGDFFAWACLVILAVFFGFAIRTPRLAPVPKAA